MPITPRQLDIFRLSIPMRRFDHAAAVREQAESILVRLEYSDGFVGWGETLPRDYVTGETLQTVPNDIAEILWPACLEEGLLNPGEPIRALPSLAPDGRYINAAACAMDLAGFRRIMHNLHDISPQVLQALAQRPRLRNYIDSRVSGVLGSTHPRKTAKRLRLMRWFGLTDFKLKLGLGEEIDRANLEICHKQLHRGLKRGDATLRVDINGGWDADSAPHRINDLKAYGVCAVEQPIYGPADALLELAGKCRLPLMADESLLTLADAEILAQEPQKIWWNVRISKNGGLLAALKLMMLAQKHHVPFTLGCMVGESSLLSAAQRRLLQMGPVPKFIEGNYGRLLLGDDLLKGYRSLMFGYGGALRIRNADGLGVTLSQDKIQQYAAHLKTLKA